MRTPLAVMALAVLAGAAMAGDDVKPRPYRVSLGTYDAKTGGSRSALSVSYDLAMPTSGKKETHSGYSSYSLYFDSNSKKRNGVSSSLSGLGVALRLDGRPEKADGGIYRGVGVGLYTIKAGASRSRLGGKAFVGYERKEGVFVEAGYTFVPKINGVDASGLGLALGYRF
jgi:hypothetical protein